jgi:hypothetical protein
MTRTKKAAAKTPLDVRIREVLGQAAIDPSTAIVAVLVDENAKGRLLFACGQAHGAEASDQVKISATKVDVAFRMAMGTLDKKRAEADSAEATTTRRNR